MRALIFSGGEFTGLPPYLSPSDFDLILAADRGYLYAESLGISPDIFVGDKDSLPKQQHLLAKETVSLPTIKDMTDTQEAIALAIDRGAKEIVIVAALGGRIDHTLANLHLLKFGKDRGAAVSLEDKDSFVTLIDKPQTFPRREGFCISLLPLTPCEHLSVSGVFYPLTDAVMEIGLPYGVSNEFTAPFAQVDPGTGELLVMICKAV